MDSHSSIRRVNVVMAEQVQCGIALMHVAGLVPAQRYLLKCGVPKSVIERVLFKAPYKRRVYGDHGVADVNVPH